MSNDKKTIAVGLSGGVDSATTALLLKEAGHDVVGVYMQNWDFESTPQCPIPQDWKDAQAVAKHIGIPFESVNFQQDYWDNVFTHFLNDHLKGLTPNPDVMCNQEIKFKVLLEHIRKEFDAILATGHYARIKEKSGQFSLLCGLDHNKDQSYFLCRLNQQQLASSLFPLGDFQKPEIRKIADKANLPVAKKKDSTGICFIGERKFQSFLSEYLLDKPGQIVDIDTQLTVGTHKGLIFYTIGQRKGIEIGGIKGSEHAPYFVVSKDLASQTLFVAKGHDNPHLFKRSLSARDLHWINEPLQIGDKINCKIRYRQTNQTAIITNIDQQRIEVLFDEAQRAISPGQYLVIYQEDELKGSAIIEASLHG